jgi:hypothetical protein
VLHKSRNVVEGSGDEVAENEILGDAAADGEDLRLKAAGYGSGEKTQKMALQRERN